MSVLSHLNIGRWNTTFQSSAQWTALDIVKAIAVAVVLFVHPHFLLITQKYAIYAPQSNVVKITDAMMFLGSFITLLPIVAGCMLRVGANQAGFLKTTLRTSVLITVLGFVMNTLTWGFWYAFSWNMLQMVAVAYLLIALVFVRLGVVGVACFAILILAVSSLASGLLDSFRHHYLVGILVGNNSKFIFWPILPWVALPAIGFVIAHGYLLLRHKTNFVVVSFLTGLALMCVSVCRGEFSATLNYQYVWSQLMVQPPLWELLGGVGLFCVLLAVSEFAGQYIKPSRYGIVNAYSKAVLWIYLMQMIVSYHLAPYIVNTFNFQNRLNLLNLSDVLAYAFFPLLMLMLGWVFGVFIIKLMQESRLRITFRKVSA